MKNLVFLVEPARNFKNRLPSQRPHSNKFLKQFTLFAKKKKFKMYIASADWIKKNTIEKAWYFDKTWKKAKNIPVKYAFIYFTMNKKTTKIFKHLDKYLKLMNPLPINKICSDKLGIYKMIPKSAKMKYALIHNKSQLKKILSKFPSKKIVLKPRYGIRGLGIKVVSKKTLPKKIKKDTIVQEFINTAHGIKELNLKQPHDLRVILINGKIHHSYLRLPQHSFLANCAKGAKKQFVKKKSLPSSVLTLVNFVNKKLKKYKPSLYSVDVIFENGEIPKIIELEAIPGFMFYKGHEKLRDDTFNTIFNAFKSAYKIK